MVQDISVLFLVVNHTYQHVHFGLYRNNFCLAQKQIENKSASKYLISQIMALVQSNGYRLADCTFIALNQGPGPFTTLRTIIATVNGMSFATKIPLLGVDGLEAFLDQIGPPKEDIVHAVLLNAFAGDVFWAVESAYAGKTKRLKGCDPIKDFLNLAKSLNQTKIRFLGNGVLIYQRELFGAFPQEFDYETNDTPESPSLNAIAQRAYDTWNLTGPAATTQHLMPLYLKQFSTPIA